MNLRSVVALADENITTVVCVFPESRGSTPTQYTFKCETDLARTLKPEDRVLVDTKFGIFVATVLLVHEDSQIDPESEIEYRWLFAHVDQTRLVQLRAAEDAAVERLVRRRRSVLRRRMAAMLEDDSAPLVIDGRTI